MMTNDRREGSGSGFSRDTVAAAVSVVVILCSLGIMSAITSLRSLTAERTGKAICDRLMDGATSTPPQQTLLKRAGCTGDGLPKSWVESLAGSPAGATSGATSSSSHDKGFDANGNALSEGR